jgi:hypothetical protein
MKTPQILPEGIIYGRRMKRTMIKNFRIFFLLFSDGEAGL